MALERLDITSIIVGPRLRKTDSESVAGLVESIKVMGLLHPVTVTKSRVLVAGAHRLGKMSRQRRETPHRKKSTRCGRPERR